MAATKMKKVLLISELLLGITFIFGGINGLLIPLGKEAIVPVNPDSEFAVMLSQTNYIFILQKVVELVCGILLLTRQFRFVSLIALTPIVLSILLYHIFDDTTNLPIGITVFILYIVSLIGHKENIQTLLNRGKFA